MSFDPSDAPRDAAAIFAAAVRAASADRLLSRVDWTTLVDRPLASFARVHVLAAGKGALAMAGVAEEALARSVPRERIDGVVVVPHGYLAAVPAGMRRPAHLDVLEAGHPVPDDAGTRAAQRALDVATRAGADDLVLVLLSGGASALWAAFAGDVSLADARATFALLLRSGAPIEEMNVVRRHLSRIGGGWLAAAAHPAVVRALVLSDVVGDDPSVIGSGPTVADPTRHADAIATLEARDAWARVPASVRRRLERGAAGLDDETPKPGDPRLRAAHTTLVGSNADALAAAEVEARRLGYDVHVVDRRACGEARTLGRRIVATLDAARGARPVCLLWGGETTVTVRGRGRGGRNQTVALAAALALEGLAHDATVLSAGTDGIDGPTDAAGAIVGARTAAEVRARGLDPAARLDDDDAYTALDAVGALLRTGPTHTNVMDVQVALIR